MGEKLLNPLLSWETFNWEEGSDGRKSAMEALKAYAKQLDPRDLPLFLTQISDAKENGFVPLESMISLYEVVARVHGINVVPYINKIMGSIIHNLAANVVSSPLQQACSKVVIAIARYGIDPTTPQDEKRRVIHSLCEPLSDSLLGSRESLTSGAPLCLTALADSDNWQFASDEMVNRVCQNVAVALGGKSTQSNPQMGLVLSLAEHNPLIVEAYARLLIQSGLQILHRGNSEENPHKRRSAIQMIHILMKCLHPRSVYSELKLITEEMERSQSDVVPFVRGAALEAWETARKIAAEEEMKLQKDSCSITGSNFRRRRGGRRNGGSSSSDRSSGSVKSDSRVVDKYNIQLGSSISSRLASPGSNSDRRSVNRKLWKFEDGLVDISVKNGLFSGLGNENSLSYTPPGDSGNQGLDNDVCNCADQFQVFGHGSCANGEEGQVSVPISRVSPDFEDSSDMGIFGMMQTPTRSVEIPSPGEVNRDSPEGRIQRSRSTPLCRNKLNFVEDAYSNGPSDVHEIIRANGVINNTIDHHHHDGVFSIPAEHQEIAKDRPGSGIDYRRRNRKRAPLVMICFIFFILLALSSFLQWVDVQFEADHLVPT